MRKNSDGGQGEARRQVRAQGSMMEPEDSTESRGSDQPLVGLISQVSQAAIQFLDSWSHAFQTIQSHELERKATPLDKRLHRIQHGHFLELLKKNLENISGT